MLDRTRLAVLALFGLLSMAGGPPAGAADPAEAKRSFARPVEVPFPPQNPFSAAKAAFGKALFFDPIFSASGTISCASCHHPGLAWGDGLPRAIGEARTPLALRSPTTLNLAWGELYGWDGKFPDLESVVFAPLANKANMNRDIAELIHDLNAIPGYRAMSEAAFPGGGAIDRGKIEEALATYERTIVSGQAPFDQWIDGDESAIGDAAKRGFALFVGKGECAACHGGWNLTDNAFHDIGTGGDKDFGRGRLFPGSTALQYAFKTPSLRDVAHRAPYMHDGSLSDLGAVIDLYDRGGVERPSRDSHIRRRDFSAAEKADLIAFLQTLSAEDPPTTVPRLPR
jgi:cytochrome c peroxidase